MKKDISLYLSCIALSIYFLLFAGILTSVIFNNVIFQYRVSICLIMLAVLALFLAVFLFVYNKFASDIIKHRYKLLAIISIFIFAIQMVISCNMEQNFMYDHDKTFNAAVVWVTQGNSEDFQLYSNYLHHTPHQMGIFLVQQLLFKISTVFGFTNYFMVACIAGHILFMIMNVTAFKYLDEFISSHAAVFYLLIAIIYVPLYFQSSISYTDSWTAWAAPCTLLYVSRAVNADSKKGMFINGIMAGVLTGVAIQIKSTTVFVLIAMIINIIVKGVKKNHLQAMAVVMCCLLITGSCFEKWNYATVLEEYRDGEAMPITNWIMMGLQGDGSYSGYDEWEITCSVPPDERMDLNIKVIKERLSEMGPSGYIKLLYKKTCRSFGSGNADLRYSFKYEEDSNPSTLLYHMVFENGRFYGIINNLSHGVYLMLNLLGITGAAIILFKYRKEAYNFVPYVALIGFWIFMMLWESNHRQLINQWSLYFITAATGLYYIWRLWKDRKSI